MPRNRTESAINKLNALTWDDLNEWVGSRSVGRGRSYQKNKRVHDLAQLPDGGIIAWVQGERRYVTSVKVERGRLNGTCTCPIGGQCKHAVAVVVDYLEHLKNDLPVPLATDDDERLELLVRRTPHGENESDTEEWDDEDEEEPTTTREEKSLSVGIEQLSKEQLLELVEDLAKRHPSVREDLRDRSELATGDVKRLVKSVKSEIESLTAEPAWSDQWSHESHIPDFSRVRSRLEALLAKGHADEVVKLGATLLKSGTDLIEMSNDEGETGMEVSSCMEVVFRALPRSSLSPAEQMEWATNAALSDEHELCEGAYKFLSQKHTAQDWNTLAEELTAQLINFKPRNGTSSFSTHYNRDRLTDRLIEALQKSGRRQEIIPLCLREAPITNSYERLVGHLKQAKRWTEAEEWIRKGIAATQKDLPGIAANLRKSLLDIRKKDKDTLGAAALLADEFFLYPSLETYRALQKGAERANVPASRRVGTAFRHAGVWPAVREVVLFFLETGKPPEPKEHATDGRTIPPWPLPESGVMQTEKPRKNEFPDVDTLIDIAIAEKRVDDVLRWYDRRRQKGTVWFDFNSTDDRVAEAVVQQYPERSISIWKTVAEGAIARTQPKMYEVAAGYLRKVRRALQNTRRDAEWRSYLSALRESNKKKRRLVEILDTLEGAPILSGVLRTNDRPR